MLGMYKLEGKIPVEVKDASDWAMNFDIAKRTVAKSVIGKVRISTVFLGLDHNYSQMGPPILFETMIFGGKHDEYQERYATWDEAVEGHNKAVKLVKGD